MTPQELNLELIRITSFNELNGAEVAKDLEDNKELWESAVLTRLENLIYLRDLSSNIWNVDTLFILPKAGCEDRLKDLASTWNADELDWCTSEEAHELLGRWGGGLDWSKKLLRVWWD